MVRLRRPVQRALRDARLRLPDLTGVVLAGGATRMPMNSGHAGQMVEGMGVVWPPVPDAARCRLIELRTSRAMTP